MGKSTRKIITWLALLFASALLITIYINLTRQGRASLEPVGDFLQYWTAGRLNINGQNPYDPTLVDTLQEPYNPGEPPLYMWVMPWVYGLVMPFGLMPFSVSRLLWFFGQMIGLLACANLLWRQYQGQQRWLWLAWGISFLHWASLEILRGGQISLLTLLGAVLFLVLEGKRHYILAGMALALVTLKPHTLYLFSLAVMLWVLEKRRWNILLGWAGAVVSGMLIALLPNPALLWQYLEASQKQPPSQWVTATIGGQLRLYFSEGQFWLQFLPVAVGILWLGWYWWRHHHRWNWQERIPLLALVSSGTAAYGWRHDQIVTILAILPAMVWILQMASRQRQTVFIAAYLLLNWIACTAPYPQHWFWWLPLAMIAWFLAVQKVFNAQNKPA